MISCYVTQPFGSDVATLYTTSDWTAGSVPPKAAVLFCYTFLYRVDRSIMTYVLALNVSPVHLIYAILICVLRLLDHLVPYLQLGKVAAQAQHNSLTYNVV